jgi:hypothetical protein
MRNRLGTRRVRFWLWTSGCGLAQMVIVDQFETCPKMGPAADRRSFLASCCGFRVAWSRLALWRKNVKNESQVASRDPRVWRCHLPASDSLLSSKFGRKQGREFLVSALLQECLGHDWRATCTKSDEPIQVFPTAVADALCAWHVKEPRRTGAPHPTAT